MHLATSCQNKREEKPDPGRQGICLRDAELSNRDHNPESKCLVSSDSILFSRPCVHLGSLPPSLLTRHTLASCVSNFQVTLRGFIEICSLCPLSRSRECSVSSNTSSPVAYGWPFLQETVLSISSIAAGISYSKRIKREVPIPRQLGCYGVGCFDYSR